MLRGMEVPTKQVSALMRVYGENKYLLQVTAIPFSNVSECAVKACDCCDLCMKIIQFY